MLNLFIKHPTQGVILLTPIGLVCMIIVNIVFNRFTIIPKERKDILEKKEEKENEDQKTN